MDLSVADVDMLLSQDFHNFDQNKSYSFLMTKLQARPSLVWEKKQFQ